MDPPVIETWRTRINEDGECTEYEVSAWVRRIAAPCNGRPYAVDIGGVVREINPEGVVTSSHPFTDVTTHGGLLCYDRLPSEDELRANICMALDRGGLPLQRV